MSTEQLLDQSTNITEETIRRLPSLSYSQSTTRTQIDQQEIQVYGILNPIEEVAKYRTIIPDRVDVMLSKEEYPLALKLYSGSISLENTQDEAKVFKTPKKGVIGIDYYDDQYIGYRFHYYVSEEDFPIVAAFLNQKYQSNIAGFTHTEVVTPNKLCVTHQLRNCSYRYDIVLHATDDSFSDNHIRYSKADVILQPIKVAKPDNETVEVYKQTQQTDLKEDKEEFCKFIETVATLINIDDYRILINGSEIYKTSDQETTRSKALASLEIKYNGKESFIGTNFFLAILAMRLKYPFRLEKMEALCNAADHKYELAKILRSKRDLKPKELIRGRPQNYIVNNIDLSLINIRNDQGFNHGSLHWYFKTNPESYDKIIAEFQKLTHGEISENTLLTSTIKSAHPTWYSYNMHITK